VKDARNHSWLNKVAGRGYALNALLKQSQERINGGVFRQVERPSLAEKEAGNT